MKTKKKTLLPSKPPGHLIVKTDVTNQNVAIRLQNGVTIYLSSNNGYVHLSFSGTDVPMKATPVANSTIPGLVIANYVDIEYKTMNEEGYYK